MTERLSLIVAFAALVLSVASPLISAWISGHYRIKEIELQQKNEREKERQDFYIRHRAEVIEKYVRTAGTVLFSRDYSELAAFGEAAGEIVFYVSGYILTMIETMNEEIASHRFDEARKSFGVICRELATEAPRLEDGCDDGEENGGRTDGKKNQNKKEWWPKRLIKAWREKKTRSDGGKEAKGQADNGKDNK